MERFTIDKNPDKALHWDCTDHESGLIGTFEYQRFCSSLVIKSPIGVCMPDYLDVQKIIKDMGNWLIDNHRDKFF